MDAVIPDDTLAQWQALADAATEADWDIDRRPGWGLWHVTAPARDGHPGFSRIVCDHLSESDAAFIASAREAVPQLLAEVAQLREPYKLMTREAWKSREATDKVVARVNEAMAIGDSAACRADMDAIGFNAGWDGARDLFRRTLRGES